MKDMSDLFSHRKVDFSSLDLYGFKKNNQGYCYSIGLLKDQFYLTVKITFEGEISTTIIDKSTREDYFLHQIMSVNGVFVGKLREEYKKEMIKIAEQCFIPNIFQSVQAKQIIQFIQQQYHDELEFLWKNHPDNAIVRRKDTKKWYAALLVIESKKLGIDSKERIDIIDLRMLPTEVIAVVDNKKYFPGFHMNKKHWITICLNDSVPTDEIFARINASFMLAIK